jgi:hypothetical protein
MISILLRQSICSLLCLLPMVAGAASGNYDRGFLGDYTKLQSRAAEEGVEHIYTAPGSFEALARYTGVMVDQPEILVSPESDYRGAKPEDLAAIARMMREALAARLSAGGYNVVEAPGPGVIYVRLALTDLQLKKKKRGVLGYTPIGFVVKAGSDALKDMMDKYDIMNMVIQAELTDSQSNEVIAAIVGERGGGEKPVRLDFEQLDAQMKEFGSRLRCRLDNARVAEPQRIDCLDPRARDAREAAATRP